MLVLNQIKCILICNIILIYNIIQLISISTIGMSEQGKKQKQTTIILDANAFISGIGLLDLAANNKLVTTSQVMEQLRDPKTRHVIDKFPFTIHEQQPQKKSIQVIKQFAKKTGDIASLSDVDLHLLALAHTLYIRNGLSNKMRSTPLPMREVADQDQQQQQQFQQQDQQYDEQQQNKQQSTQKDAATKEQAIKQKGEVQNKQQKLPQVKQKQQNKQQNNDDDDGWIVVPKSKPKPKQQSDQDMDDEQGWVTPKNYQQKMAQGNAKFVSEAEQSAQKQQSTGISLMTADYAMQNVALQMGIQLKSLDGRQIKEVRRFILQCYLCWKQYQVDDNKIKLCKQCGYNSLSKIAYSLNPNGEKVLHRKKGWKPNQKVLEWKERKYEEQQKKKKHQHARRKKQASIFQV